MIAAPGFGSRIRRNDDGAPRRIEHRHIVAAVAHIVETALPEARNQRFALAVMGKVQGFRGMHDVGEQAGMGGDVARHRFGSPRHEDDLPARQLLALEALQHGIAIGPVGRHAAGAACNLKLQAGLALQHPADHREDHQGIAQQQDGHALPQRIGGHKRTVQVHAKRNMPRIGPGVHESKSPVSTRAKGRRQRQPEAQQSYHRKGCRLMSRRFSLPRTRGDLHGRVAEVVNRPVFGQVISCRG